MHLDKQLYKIPNMKNLAHCNNYSSNNAISSFKQAKCSNICPLMNFYKFTFLSASLSTGTDLEPILLCTYIAFKLYVISIGTNLCYSNHNTHCAPSPVLFLLEIKVLTFNHGINIPYKVFKHNSKQLG